MKAQTTRRGILRAGGALLALIACAALLHLLVYMNVLGFRVSSLAAFPGSVAYLARTTSRERPGAPACDHPLEAPARAAAARRRDENPGGGLSSSADSPCAIRYDRPLGTALQAAGRSFACVGLTLVWVSLLSALRIVVRTKIEGGFASRRLRLLGLGDRVVEQFQRLPGLVIFFLAYGLIRVAHGRLPESIIGQALALSLVLANSDGLVPDFASVMRHRFREIEQRDYVKAGLLLGQRKLALMRRELALTASDLVGGRILQIMGGAFLLELLMRYPGIGRACVLNLYGPSGSGASTAWWADAIAKSDLLASMLYLLLVLSFLILIARYLLQSLLDPRPRTGVA